jgi:hypothetical protein
MMLALFLASCVSCLVQVFIRYANQQVDYYWYYRVTLVPAPTKMETNLVPTKDAPLLGVGVLAICYVISVLPHKNCSQQHVCIYSTQKCSMVDDRRRTHCKYSYLHNSAILESMYQACVIKKC